MVGGVEDFHTLDPWKQLGNIWVGDHHFIEVGAFSFLLSVKKFLDTWITYMN